MITNPFVPKARSNARSCWIACSIYWFLLVLSPCSRGAAPLQIEAAGVLSVKSWDANGAPTGDFKRNFTVSVNGCQWQIRSSPAGGKPSNFQAWEAAGDGVEIKQVAYFNGDTIAKHPNSSNQAVGLIEYGAVPDDFVDNAISEIWLAFCSRCHLDTVTNGMMRPTYMLADPSLKTQDYRVPAYIGRLDSGLPMLVKFYDDGIIRGRDASGAEAVFEAPRPWDTGFTAADFRVLGTTNANGSTLPTRFVARQFFALRNGPGKATKEWKRVEGEVTQISSRCAITEFAPSLRVPTAINDLRFARLPKPAEAVTYTISDGAWKSLDAPEVRQAYKMATRFPPTPKVPPRPPHSYVPLVCFLAVGLVVTLVAANMVRRLSNRA